MAAEEYGQHDLPPETPESRLEADGAALACERLQAVHLAVTAMTLTS